MHVKLVGAVNLTVTAKKGAPVPVPADLLFGDRRRTGSPQREEAVGLKYHPESVAVCIEMRKSVCRTEVV